MSSLLLLKKSSVSGKIPVVGDLDYGELAINYTDGQLYYKTNTNTIAGLIPTTSTIRSAFTAGTGISITDGVIASSAALTINEISSSANTTAKTINNISTLKFDSDSGFDVTDLGSGAVKIGMNSTFKTWVVSGQPSLIASGLDTIEFIAGNGISITTNSTTNPKSIRIANTVSGGGVSTSRFIQEATALAGQTSFSITGGYNVGYIDVFLNGVYLSGSDYTATNGTSVVLGTGATAGDILRFVVFEALSVANVYLGVGTVGNYVETITAGTGVSITGANTASANVTVNLNLLGIQNLTDPNTDKLMFWRDSVNYVDWLDLGSGLSISGTTITNTGVLSNIAGTGITVSSATGNVTITNSGVISLAAGTGISLSATNGSNCSISIGQAVSTTSNVTFNNITASGNLTVTGTLIVNGTTTTVNSTITTLDDPIITLGGDTAPASDDNKDRGVEYRWHNGTAAKVGFFGFDDSTGYFTFIPDATNSSEVFSGTPGDFQATNFRGALIGNASTATILQTARNIQGISFNGSADITVLTAGTGITVTGTQVSIPQAISTSSNVQFGSFGVGTAASGVSGEVRATGNIVAYYSDERLKTNLGNIENALDKLKSLSGFYYEPNELAQKLGYKLTRDVGLSAQQVEKVLPEVVVPAPIDSNYKTIHYDKVIPLIVEAIKELDSFVRNLIHKKA